MLAGLGVLGVGRGGFRCKRFVDTGLGGGGCLDVLAVGGLVVLVGLLLCLGAGDEKGRFVAFFWFCAWWWCLMFVVVVEALRE